MSYQSAIDSFLEKNMNHFLRQNHNVKKNGGSIYDTENNNSGCPTCGHGSTRYEFVASCVQCDKTIWETSSMNFLELLSELLGENNG